MSVQKFFGVGKVTAATMADRGILTGADLKLQTEAQLRHFLGERGSLLYHFVRGEDERAVEPTRIRKSVGKETTLPQDSGDPAQMLVLVEQLTGQVERRLVELGVGGRTVTLKITWSDFQQITRRVTTTQAFQQAETMLPLLHSLFGQVETEKRPVRLLGVTVSQLVPWSGRNAQEMLLTPSLWDEGGQAQEL